MQPVISTRFREIFKNVFPSLSDAEYSNDLKMGDFLEWDSLGNFRLILALEAEFGVQFEIHELEQLSSVTAMSSAIVEKIHLRSEELTSK